MDRDQLRADLLIDNASVITWRHRDSIALQLSAGADYSFAPSLAASLTFFNFRYPNFYRNLHFIDIKVYFVKRFLKSGFNYYLQPLPKGKQING